MHIYAVHEPSNKITLSLGWAATLRWDHRPYFLFCFVFFAMEFLRHACLTRWYPMSILLLHIHFVLHLAVQCENETEYKCCMATVFLTWRCFVCSPGSIAMIWNCPTTTPSSCSTSSLSWKRWRQTPNNVSFPLLPPFFFLLPLFSFTSLFIYAHVCSLKELDSPVWCAGGLTCCHLQLKWTSAAATPGILSMESMEAATANDSIAC